MSIKTHIKKAIEFFKRAHIFHKISIVAIILFMISTVCFGYISWINYSQIKKLSNNVSTLQVSLASTTQTLEDTILKNRTDLASAIMEQKQNVGVIQNQLGNYREQVGTITGTVTTLQKLSKTDPQLLQKYSKVFFLNENYAPAELTEVLASYNYSTTKHTLVDAPVWSYLKKMLDDASSTAKMYVASGYRSFSEQSALKGEYKVTYGAGTANSFSADQGYSEHQLGTAVDLITPGLGGQLNGFDKTIAYTWLMNNAYKYGFVISYPKNNPFYVFEPWHWRFVGVKLATDLNNANQFFYDKDQRVLDGYLVNLFD
jgi:LAS superfamily LD-carboxypeptidase LdcB